MSKRFQRIRPWQGIAVLAVLLIGIGAILTSCSEDVTEPNNAAATLQSATGDGDSEAAMKWRFAGLEDLGIDISGASGVLTIGWREGFNRKEESAEVRGGADAVAFSQPFDSDAAGGIGGVDMGDVTLTSPDGDYALNKHDGRRGVKYSTRAKWSKGNRPDGERVNVAYSAGGTYTFDIAGSDDFGAASAEVVAPDALLEITNVAHGDEVDATTDLTIEWTGGMDGKVMVAVMAPKARREGKRGHHGARSTGMEGKPEGNHPHQGHHGDHGRRPRFDDSRIHREVLESNTGSVTVSAATIQALLAASGSDRLMVHIGQAVATNVDAGGKTLVAIVRTGDGVGLTTASSE